MSASTFAEIIAWESIGLEQALSMLRLEFQKLSDGSDGSSMVVDPDDAIFGSNTVAPHDLDMTLLRYLKVARSTLSKRDKHDVPKLVSLAL